jgi:hypothetical protein
VINALANWLHATSIGWAAGGGLPWVEPLCKILHFFGLALLFGSVAVFDLRVLGVATALPLKPFRRLTPFASLGFLINLATGLTFLAGNPRQYLDNVAFWLKMLFVVLAGINVLVFYASGLGRKVDEVGAGQSAPIGAKMVAGASLFLWIGVMYWGRMLAFIGNAF